MFVNLLPSSLVRRVRRFPFAWWLAVIAIAVTGGFIVTTALSHADAAAARYGGLTNVYIATRALQPGALITDGDVRTESRPRAFIPRTPLNTNPRGAVVTETLANGDVITATNTGVSGLSATAALLHPGEQGIAVPIDDKSPDFQIGDNVSVFATFDASDPTASTPTIAITTRARVVHVSDHAVTIAVSDDEAPKLAFAVAKGLVTAAITIPAGPDN